MLQFQSSEDKIPNLAAEVLIALMECDLTEQVKRRLFTDRDQYLLNASLNKNIVLFKLVMKKIRI